ncbi:PglL family O-oligosaccharyltransferase, partial [Methylophaga sp. OBS4]|uniref:PglL family O-oligosaccharyltransferase n=1 Tax=Methylophaga sp. OBS4 TaxID=2991935 RepID=UPI002252FE65
HHYLTRVLAVNLKQGRWDKLLYIIALSGLVHAAIGIAQIWLKADMPYLLPKSPNGVPSGLFQQINNQATFLVAVISLSLFLAARPLLYKRRLFMQLLLVITVLLSAYIVGVSGSRIGALTLFISVPLLIFALRRPLLRNSRFSAAILLAIVMGFSAGLLPGTSKAIDKTVAMQSGYSGSARLGIYKISLDLVAEKPVFGHGVGSFASVFQFARPAFFEQNPDGTLPKQIVSHPHNEIIQWLVEGGLIALMGIVLVAIGVLRALRQTGWSRGLAYTGLLLPIVLHTQVELPLYTSILHWFVLVILLALPFSHQLTNRNNSLTIYANKLAAISLWAIVGIFILFLLHTVRSNWDFVAFYKGEQRENPLQIAKQNPYLSDQAQWIDMSAMMYSSMQYGLKDNVEFYTNWGEQYLTKRPDVDLYQKLTDAYEFLGNKPAYCDVAKRGFEIYPQAERLQRAVEYCRY